MPELPEVEIARRSIEPALRKQIIVGAVCRTARLRWPLDPALADCLRQRRIGAVRRRGKYLLIECQAAPQLEDVSKSPPDTGWLLIHLGMSGNLRLHPRDTPPALHDHFDLILRNKLLRLHDPRRFGAVLWHPGRSIDAHPLLAALGPEPFDPELDGAWLHKTLSRRHGPIKPALMDSHLIVGIGNIYASESLFQAGISPLRAASRISEKRCASLLDAARKTLDEAIQAGGSSLRDYVHTDGGNGGYQLQYAVYGRTGQACLRCTTPIRALRQAGRSTYYCPNCQR